MNRMTGIGNSRSPVFLCAVKGTSAETAKMLYTGHIRQCNSVEQQKQYVAQKCAKIL